MTFTRATFETLDALEAELNEMGSRSSEYWDKQVHKVPPSTVVDRDAFLVERCTGKTVLHIGCTGVLDEALRKVSKRCYGIDKEPQDRPDFFQQDIEFIEDALRWFEGVELIVCGEVLEHIGNPLNFLLGMREAYEHAPVLITVPNAFHLAGQEWLVKRGRENVNKDHVCYYSYTTLKELLRRAGYQVVNHWWYHGKPYISEGLIVEATPA